MDATAAEPNLVRFEGAALTFPGISGREPLGVLKDIKLEVIARMNRDFLAASWMNRSEEIGKGAEG